MAVEEMTRKEALIIGKIIADRWYRCYFEAIKQQQKKTNYSE